MAGVENIGLSVVTFNIGGDGTSHDKKEKINAFLNVHVRPSLLYFQENPWRGDNIKKYVQIIQEKYEAVSHINNHATVFYRKDVLRDDGSAELMTFFQEGFNDKKHLDFLTFKERASFSKLTEIQTGTSFLAISWHGEHSNLNYYQKKEKLEDFFKVIREIHSKTNLPVVLGGDFNIALDMVSDSIENVGFEVYDYVLVNRETLIDFFVVTPDVELSGVSAFGQYMYAENNKGETQRPSSARSSPKKLKVFDHVPVQAKVAFVGDVESDKNPIPLFENLLLSGW